MRRRRARTLLTLGALAATLVGPTGAASADGVRHGALRASQPKSGAHLAVAPSELRLTFTEPAELAVARIELLGPGDSTVALSPLRHGDSATVVVTSIIGTLRAATYTVAWQVTGRDGHPVRGRFRFTIAPGAAGLASAATAAPHEHADAGGDTARTADGSGAAMRDTGEVSHPDPTALPVGRGFDAESPLFAAVRWLGYVGMLGLVGAVGFARIVLPGARRAGALLPAADAALRRVGLAAAVTLLVATVLRLAAQSAAMHDGDETTSPAMIGAMVAHTLWGRAWLLQVAATLLGIAGLAMLPRRAAGWMVVVTSIVACAIAMAMSGHAAAVPRLAPLVVAADALHILGAGGWLGTLLVLVLVGLPVAMRGDPPARGAAVAALVNAFSPLALACAALVMLTGVAAAWVHLESPGALFGTAYGLMLFRKLVLLAVVLALGAWNWRRVRPTLGDDAAARRIRRSSIGELAVGALVLAATALLAATPI